MTHKERFRTVLRRERPDRLPFVARLDLWHTAARASHTLPPELEGLSIPQIEARLGMGRSARFSGLHTVHFDGAEKAECREGERLQTRLSFGGRTLQQVSFRTAEQERQGVSGHLHEYYLKSAEDYATMTAIWERMRWEFRPEAFEPFARDAGDDGLPVLILGPSPIHFIMLAYAGYNQFYLHLVDFPDRIEALVRVMEARYAELWRAAAATSAELVLHGAHWSTDMTPRPLFRRYFLPYFQRFTQAMHAAGKSCAFHGDADLSGLKDEVLETGMDVADCFACAPLVPLTLAEARRHWGDRVIIWGGIPSTVLMPSCPLPEFHACLDGFLRDAADGRAVIAAISDNLMPDSDWPRIRELAERVTTQRLKG